MRTFAVAMTLLLLVGMRDADAHAFLVKSDPVVGASIAAPKTLRLEFSEAVELGFSGMAILDRSGAEMKIGAVHHDGSNRKVLVADLPPLSSGAYRVTWHVVSVDTHRTEGDFSFTVRP